MHTNQAYIGHTTRNNRPRKWWHHRWFKIICISFIILTIFAVTLSLLLKFVILAPKKPDSITTTTTSAAVTTISTSLSSTSTSTSTSTPTLTSISTLTSTSILTLTTTLTSISTSTTITTTPQSREL
ncbi:unnamed protein product [Rotaria sp. Silwood2]|nr:unnamed protein product [Rotaria sp. Silwood2]